MNIKLFRSLIVASSSFDVQIFVENSVNQILKILDQNENIYLNMKPINSENKKAIQDIHTKPEIKSILYPLVCNDLELYKAFLHANISNS